FLPGEPSQSVFVRLREDQRHRGVRHVVRQAAEEGDRVALAEGVLGDQRRELTPAQAIPRFAHGGHGGDEVPLGRLEGELPGVAPVGVAVDQQDPGARGRHGTGGAGGCIAMSTLLTGGSLATGGSGSSGTATRIVTRRFCGASGSSGKTGSRSASPRTASTCAPSIPPASRARRTAFARPALSSQLP